MKKIKIAILSGGPSSEHEVSLDSAKNIIDHLDLNKFDIINIKIEKDGAWLASQKNKSLSESEGIKYLKGQDVDLVFIALHGEYGEDGTLQEILENEGIKFTGSKSKISKTAMDKVISSKIFNDVGLKVPDFFQFQKEEWSKNSDEIVEKGLRLGLPLVVKPVDRGSSVGIGIVKEKSQIADAIETALEYSDKIMLQQFVGGRELTCGVIEGINGEDIPLIPTEIIPDKDCIFFDYKAKYEPGASIEVTPPDLPKEIIEEIQRQAKAAHSAIGCTGVSRSDFILSDNTLYILEVNTIPGMTKTSLLPQGAKAMGIELPILIESIIKSCLR